MNEIDERQAFIDAIAADRRDLVNRLAYSDWLDEHDEPELADFHRTWTVQKYDDALKWLEEFAEMLNRKGANPYDDDDPDPDDSRNPHLDAWKLLSAMQKRANLARDGGNIYDAAEIFLDFDTPDECWSQRGRMWECFELIIGQKVTYAVKEPGLFHCAC